MNDKQTDQLIKILYSIIKENYNKSELIEDFQQSVWNSDTETVEHEIFNELAYDLDYYEPNEQLRKENSSYYGEERLIKEIESAINKIKRSGSSHK
ncbi:MAG: hypothetical protein WCF65_08100 [Parachlamydiaceae bacterium]